MQCETTTAVRPLPSSQPLRKSGRASARSLLSTSFGFGEVGMFAARDWRGRGVGSALLDAAIEFARGRGLHKLSLSVFAHNEPAIALYRKYGFVEEGRRVKHFRRANGELWDALEMGLML